MSPSIFKRLCPQTSERAGGRGPPGRVPDGYIYQDLLFLIKETRSNHGKTRRSNLPHVGKGSSDCECHATRDARHDVFHVVTALSFLQIPSGRCSLEKVRVEWIYAGDNVRWKFQIMCLRTMPMPDVFLIPIIMKNYTNTTGKATNECA